MPSAIQRPPGPEGGIYGIGNLINFQRDTLGFLSKAANKYGDIAYYQMAAFHFYQLNHPDHVYEVLIKQGKKIEKWGRQTDTWANAVGHSTLTMEGDQWKKHRNILNPAFHSQTVKRYDDIIIRHTDRLLNRWQDGQSYEMMFEMMRTTMGIIADIIFSVEDIERDASDLNQALTAVFEVLTARTTAFQQLPPWVPTGDNLRIRNATKVIEKFILDLIHQRRSDGGDYGDILSDLMDAEDEETGEKLTDREILYELKTLFGAGHETTALMLMWTLYLLSLNPEIQEKLHDEAITLLGNRHPSLEDIPGLTYTDKVIHESMRVFPPAWSLMVRKVLEDIQVSDATIPAGSVLMIPMWVVHRNPEVYQDPLRFDPERFDGDWKQRYPKYAFFPFGGGPHVCVGAHLAMFEGHLMLPMMIQRFRYEYPPQPEPQLQALLTLRPKDGLQIRVNKR
jgi:cytochrome P450